MSWEKTRYCSCGECRFHGKGEPGWEKCPNEGKKGIPGRWLWVRISSSPSDLESVDKAYIKQQNKTVKYEEVDDLD